MRSLLQQRFETISTRLQSKYFFYNALIEAVRTHSAVCWIIITDEIERERYLFSAFYDIRMHSALCAMTVAIQLTAIHHSSHLSPSLAWYNYVNQMKMLSNNNANSTTAPSQILLLLLHFLILSSQLASLYFDEIFVDATG